MKKSVWLKLLFFFLLPVVVLAQGVTTGALSGTVVDNEGTGYPGALIAAVHIPTGTAYTAISRENGRWNIPAVKAGGPYTVTVSMTNFRTEKKENVYVKLGEDKQINFLLTLETVDAGEIVITPSSSIINPSRTGASTNVGQSSIENMPTISRNFSEFARMSPQVNIAENFSGSAYSVGSRNNRYNNVLIDGAVNNDLFGLAGSGTPGGQTETSPISLDAIQEFQILIAPYDVRHGGFTGGGINAITRSGTNAFEGSVFFYGRNQDFVGDGPDSTPFEEFSESTYGLRFGGPIIKNKLFFFLSGEISRMKTPNTWVINDQGGAFDFGGDDVSVADAERFLDILKNQYGYEGGEYNQFTANRKSNKLFVRFDWNINENHRLTLRHNFVDAENDRISRSAYTFGFSDSGYTYFNTTNSTVLQLDSVFSNTVHNQLILNYTTIRDTRNGPTEFPNVKVYVDEKYGPAFVAGTETYSHKNALDQDILEITDSLTIYSGKHTFVLGTHNEFFSFSNLFIRANFGAYEFIGLDNFEAGKPSKYIHDFSNDPNNPEQRSEFSAATLGFYAGDSWEISPHFNLTYGLRFDYPTIPDTPARNLDVETYFPGKRTDQTPSNLLVSPRVGFNWDISKNQQTQLRGGIGVFSGRTPYVWISNQFSNTGLEFSRLYISWGNIPDFEPDPYNQPEEGFSADSNEINLIDEDFKYPQVLRTNLAVDQELPFGFTGTIELVYTKNMNEVLYQNINVVESGVDPFDGRPLFADRTATEYSDVIYLTNTDKGYQYSLSFQLQKQYGNGSWFNAAYTYGEAKDVNSGTSSQARSNWRYNHISGDPNDPGLTYSNFDIRHRFAFGVSITWDLFKHAPTIFTAMYNGRSGRPYSSRFANDANGDGNYYNDLIYVPAGPDDVIFTNATWEEVDAYISGDPGLDDARGSIVKRNASREPWFHKLDFRLAQDIPVPGLKGHKLQVTLDIQNFLNMLNKDWGNYNQGYYRGEAVFKQKGTDPVTGKPMYSFEKLGNDRITLQDNFSRWMMQFGIRYTF
jgi:hypothetical protein